MQTSGADQVAKDAEDLREFLDRTCPDCGSRKPLRGEHRCPVPRVLEALGLRREDLDDDGLEEVKWLARTHDDVDGLPRLARLIDRVKGGGR